MCSSCCCNSGTIILLFLLFLLKISAAYFGQGFEIKNIPKSVVILIYVQATGEQQLRLSDQLLRLMYVREHIRRGHLTGLLYLRKNIRI